MKSYSTGSIRNVSIVAHAGVGKTSLVEAMLFTTGAIPKMGRTDDGNTYSDYDPDEISRKTTLAVKPNIVEWRDHKLNVLDTPGYEDFYGDLESALRVSDATLVLVDGEAGVQGGTEKVWDAVNRYGLPRAIVIARLDREQVDFEKAVGSIEQILEVKPVLLQVPIGSGPALKGVVDLLTMKAFVLAADGKSVTETDIPDDLAGVVEEAREALIEAAAEGEEALTEKYLEGEELTPEELARGLAAAIKSGSATPVLCVSAQKNIGVSALLDFIVNCLPSPAERPTKVLLNGTEAELPADPNGPLAALVFKTVSDPFAGRLNLFRVYSGKVGIETVQNTTKGTPERIGKVTYPSGKHHLDTTAVVAGDIGSVVKLGQTATGDTLARSEKPYVFPPIAFPKPAISLAVYPLTEGDDDRLGSALARISDEDPTFIMSRNNETRETLVSGLGDMHLQISLERAKRKFNASARLSPPKIAYRETLAKPAKNVEYTHKKQTGGAGQYAKIVLDVEPLPRGSGYEYVDRIFGGAIDQSFRPSVDKGVQAVMTEGSLYGYPVVDVRVALVDGKTHPVDSKDIAFQIAGREGFKKAAETAGVVLLEPVMSLEILVPEESMGDVIGDLNGRRGRVMGMDQVGKRQIIRAQVPLAELARYQTDLKSMTSARGSYTMEFSHYEEVPREMLDKIVAANKQ